MYSYYLRLAIHSLRKNPVLTALMIGAIAIGIGVSMTTLTVHHIMSSNPIPQKSDDLHLVRLDSWNPAEPYDDDQPEEGPWQLTFTDMMALRESDIPTRQTAMMKATYVVQPDRTEVNPFQEEIRMTDGDFFEMFDVPFIYGTAWSKLADETGEFVVILGREMNEKLFGGENSIGRELKLDDHIFTVVGVIDDWDPAPKYYDVNNGAFDASEQLFMPLVLVPQLEKYSSGNTNCWKDEKVDDYQGFLNSECVWFQFWAELTSADEKDRYQTFLDGYAMSQKELGRFGRPLHNQLTPVMDWLHNVAQVVRNDNKALVGLSFMFLIVCLVNTIGMLLAKFLGKAPQIGIRRALGASKLAVFQQQLAEVSVIGFAGGLIGLGLARLGLSGAAYLYEAPEHLIYLDINMMITAVVIAVVASILAGLYPAWQVCRMPPAQYLKTQ